MNISTLIFDYGGVLSLHPAEEDFLRLAAVIGLPLDTFLPAYWHDRAAYDRQALQADEYWAGVEERTGAELTQQDVTTLIREDIRLWSRLSGTMVAFARQARQSGLRTAVLSNMPADLGNALRQNSPLFSYFTHVTLSCDAGVVKPQPAIYQSCLEGLGASAAEALFLDDRPENVAAAAALGIHTYQFGSPAQFAADRHCWPTLPDLDLTLAPSWAQELPK